MTGELFIVGAGGHAKVAIAAARSMGWRPTRAFDDEPARRASDISGVWVSGDCGEALAQDQPVHLAIGSNADRQRLAQLRGRGPWATLLHATASIETGAIVGEGTLVAMGALIQVDAVVGRHVIINTGAIVEHDCHVGDFCHLAPGSSLGGEVIIEKGVLIGLGATILPRLTIGAGAIVGAGSVVTRSVPPGVVVAGVPARADFASAPFRG